MVFLSHSLYTPYDEAFAGGRDGTQVYPRPVLSSAPACPTLWSRLGLTTTLCSHTRARRLRAREPACSAEAKSWPCRSTHQS